MLYSSSKTELEWKMKEEVSFDTVRNTPWVLKSLPEVFSLNVKGFVNNLNLGFASLLLQLSANPLIVFK